MAVLFDRRIGRIGVGAAVIAALALWGVGCGDDEPPAGPTPPDDNSPDTIPPAAVTDLRLRSPTSNSLALVWTAPGDDGTEGTAASYDIRFSTALIDPAGWDAADRVEPSSIPQPKPGGQIETLVVLPLESAKLYYFALKTSDEKGNGSGMSNCACGETLDEKIPPAAVHDLCAEALDDTTFKFVWTATGDDWMAGQASGYELRYSRNPIDDEPSWQAATSGGSLPATKSAGETETAVRVSTGFRTNLFFALKAVDDRGNWSSLSNCSAGMAFSLKLWVFPASVNAGESATVLFRSIGSEELQVGLHSGLGWNQCSDNLVKVLTAGQFPVGVHEAECDFIDPSSGHYVPAGEYYILFCRDDAMVAPAIVQFVR